MENRLHASNDNGEAPPPARGTPKATQFKWLYVLFHAFMRRANNNGGGDGDALNELKANICILALLFAKQQREDSPVAKAQFLRRVRNCFGDGDGEAVSSIKSLLSKAGPLATLLANVDSPSSYPGFKCMEDYMEHLIKESLGVPSARMFRESFAT